MWVRHVSAPVKVTVKQNAKSSLPSHMFVFLGQGVGVLAASASVAKGLSVLTRNRAQPTTNELDVERLLSNKKISTINQNAAKWSEAEPVWSLGLWHQTGAFWLNTPGLGQQDLFKVNQASTSSCSRKLHLGFKLSNWQSETVFKWRLSWLFFSDWLDAVRLAKCPLKYTIVPYV